MKQAPQSLAVGLFGLLALIVTTCCGDEPTENGNERRRAQLLEQMRGLAAQTKVQFARPEQTAHTIELVKNPVFRYDDQPRRFIDATMWVWKSAGRPVAFQKIEAKIHVENGQPQWGYCFTSASSELLTVEWAADRAFRATEPGIGFRPLIGAPAVAMDSLQRKRQARELVRKLSARALIDPRKNTTQEMRLLTTPILEYTDPESNRFVGAVFAFAINGTNPDLLVMLEVRGTSELPQWQFAPARMTSGGVTLNYDKEKVWEVAWVNWTEAPFPTWTFFATPREATPEK